MIALKKYILLVVTIHFICNIPIILSKDDLYHNKFTSEFSTDTSGNKKAFIVDNKDSTDLSHWSIINQLASGPLHSTTIQKIFLWTPSFKAGQEYELLNIENVTTITDSHFQGSKFTYIIVHGFLGDGLEPWILNIKNKLLKKSLYNIISVQWPSGSQYIIIDYFHVVYHVPVVGKEIAQLLSLLQQFKGLSNDRVHIIGHSLGAHIAGFVGKNVDKRIARISGLDPAGLTFHDTDASKRLDKSDAVYVDVIHTNGCRNYLVWTDCFGIDIPIGHTDYWPNGGRHQPACRKLRHHRRRLGRGIQGRWSVGCDHMMSHAYFEESLNYTSGSNEFLARPCDSYQHYKELNCSCGLHPQFMGFYADSRGVGDFYLNTSSLPPYGLPDPACPSVGSDSLRTITVIVASSLLVTLFLVATAAVLTAFLAQACGKQGISQVGTDEEVDKREAVVAPACCCWGSSNARSSVGCCLSGGRRIGDSLEEERLPASAPPAEGTEIIDDDRFLLL